jgi:hypothetical protein
MKVGAGSPLCFNRAKYLVAGLCLAAGLGLNFVSAQAANVTIIVKTSERLEFDDNITRSVNSSGNVYSSVSTINTDFAWKMPRLELSAGTGTSFRKSTGPGKTNDLNSFDPNLSLGLVKRGLTSRFSLSSSFRVQNSTFSELDDTDITDQNTDRLTLKLNSDWAYNINSTNTFTLSGGITVVDFTKSNASLTPFIDLNAQAQWTRTLTNLTSVNANLGLSFFKADNLEERQSTTFSASADLSTRLSPRLSINVGGGVNLIKTDENRIVAGIVAGKTSDTTLGFQTNLGATYALRDIQLSLTAQQALDPSADGQLNQRSSLGFSISQKINRRSTLSLSTQVSRREAASDSSSEVSDQFSINPKYSYKLARDWEASIGYDFTYRKNDDGTAQANRLFVSLSKNTTLDP